MSGIQFQWIDSFLPQGLSYLNTPQPSDGRTYVMYHGTTRECADSIRNNGFRRSSKGMLGPGVYLSRDLEKARRYPIDHPDEDRVIIKVKVNVGRIIVITHQNHPLQETWSSNGYDSAWVPPNCGMVKSGLEENCIWDPSRIQVIEIIKPKLLRALSLTPSLTRSQASSINSFMVSSLLSSRPTSQSSLLTSSLNPLLASSLASSRASSLAPLLASSLASSRASSRASSLAPLLASSLASSRASSLAPSIVSVCSSQTLASGRSSRLRVSVKSAHIFKR